MGSIKEMFEKYEKNLKPEFRTDWKEIKGKGYGYEKENPIMVKSIQMMRDIICRMELTDYSGYSYVKELGTQESLRVSGFSGLVDHFEILFESIKEKRKQFIANLYFSAYPRIGDKSYTIVDMFAYDFNNIKLPKGIQLKR